MKWRTEMKVLRADAGSVDIDGSSVSSLSNAPGARQARKTTVSPALQMKEAFVLVTSEGKEHPGEAGDWILEATPGDVYIVKASVFEKLYELT
jgi:hypothetical protein